MDACSRRCSRRSSSWLIERTPLGLIQLSKRRDKPCPLLAERDHRSSEAPLAFRSQAKMANARVMARVLAPDEAEVFGASNELRNAALGKLES